MPRKTKLRRSKVAAIRAAYRLNRTLQALPDDDARNVLILLALLVPETIVPIPTSTVTA